MEKSGWEIPPKVCCFVFSSGLLGNSSLLLPSGDHRVCGKHAEQAGGGLLVPDLLYGSGVCSCARLHEGQAAQDPAQVCRPGLYR